MEVDVPLDLFRFCLLICHLSINPQGAHIAVVLTSVIYLHFIAVVEEVLRSLRKSTYATV